MPASYPKGWLSRAEVLKRKPMTLGKLLALVARYEDCEIEPAGELVGEWIRSGAIVAQSDGTYRAIPGGG